MTPTSRPLILAAAISTGIAIASALTGFIGDATAALVVTFLLLGFVIWSEHCAHERERRASEGLWVAAYRHEIWARREGRS